jgi:pimeloyl-ACP methyl ester carboxylesterase
MAQFTSDGLSLAYDEFGPADARKAIVLVHGFSSNKYENWKRMGWYDAVAGKGMRGLALDCRGHGASDKPHDPAMYDRADMARDVVALLDHAGIERAHVLGFSMGAHIALTLAMNEAGQMYAPERLHAVRIAAKKLRYGLELAANSGVKQAAPHVRTIKRAQEMLGKLHDLQVLQVHVAAVQAEPRTGRPQSRAALENLARHIEDQCRHLHGRYIASASVLRDAALAVRKVVVPQLAHPSRRARSIKMALSRPADARAAAGDR